MTGRDELGRWFYVCPKCKSKIFTPKNIEIHNEIEAEIWDRQICDKCNMKFEKNVDSGFTISDIIKRSGIPQGYLTKNRLPPIPEPAYWINSYKWNNLLIAGETGSGKSTSAAYVASSIALSGCKVIYGTLLDFVDEWRCYKTGNATSPIKKLFNQSLVVIDEAVDKIKSTEATSEFLFSILEGIAQRKSNTKFWILGNFYKGSIAQIFVDPEPAIRRIKTYFLVKYIKDGHVYDMMI